MTQKFDPVTLEILWRRLLSIVDEADAAVTRTAFSSLLRDAHDYTCMFTDRQIGALVASRELYGLTEEVRVAEGQKQNEKSIYAKHGPAQRPCPADPVL